MMLYQAGYRYNGVFTIFPTSLSNELQVYCDMETDGGGWIVFQRRQDGSVDFNRTWADYQTGFGDLKNEFWFGNDILRDLTGSGQWQLRVDLEDWQSNINDKFPDGGQCAVDYDSGWWFKVCHHANLNGYYYRQPDVSNGHGIVWYHWTSLTYSLKKCSMKLRQVL